MRVLIALILFIFTLSAAYTLDTAEKPTEKLHPAMGSVLQVESINRNLFHLLSIQTACFPQTTYTKYTPFQAVLSTVLTIFTVLCPCKHATPSQSHQTFCTKPDRGFDRAI